MHISEVSCFGPNKGENNINIVGISNKTCESKKTCSLAEIKYC